MFECKSLHNLAKAKRGCTLHVQLQLLHVQLQPLRYNSWDERKESARRSAYNEIKANSLRPISQYRIKWISLQRSRDFLLISDWFEGGLSLRRKATIMAPPRSMWQRNSENSKNWFGLPIQLIYWQIFGSVQHHAHGRQEMYRNNELNEQRSISLVLVRKIHMFSAFTI